jgi:(1->4)-alpha-D-glucan 1-alpha-D-glucosylmutase
VFRETHRLILRLLREGKVSGLRIDHPDGLWDPAAYLRQLQRSYLREVALAGRNGQAGELAAAAPLPELPEQARQQLAAGLAGASDLPLYVVVEKILSDGEELPTDWATHGTTGYDFGAAVGGLLVDGANRRAFDDLYARFIGRRIDERDLVNSTKKMIMLVSLAGEINALANRLNRLSEQNRRFRDFTLNSLTFAIREIIAALPVYRTYSTCDGAVAKPDRDAIEAAVTEAKRRNPRTESSIFNFIRDLLLLRFPAGGTPEERDAQCEFVMKFQQTTGPVAAKGVEDTAFYVYNRLVSLNEVGGEPSRFGLSVADFHRRNAARLQRWPHSLLASSTHDTKRSEDVRARISVLSEIPRELATALGRWSRFNARHKARVDGQAAPDRNDEYLIYQTLLGAWPFEPFDAAGQQAFVERIQAYMQKATKEAKVHTTWINPNEAYDRAVCEFIRLILDEDSSVNFLASFRPLQLRVAHFGVFNALSQTLLKLTSPGVPDIYQGNEIWDFSLVDPDNRRPVDYDLRARLLKSLRREIDRRAGPGRLAELTRELLGSYEDGRVKLYLTHRALDFRGRQPELFGRGSYEPLTADGSRADNVCAFARTLGDKRAVVVAPRLLTRLVSGQDLPLGQAAWGDTWLALGAEAVGQRFRDTFSGQILTAEERDARVGLKLAEVFAHFPAALLERVGE